MSSATKALQDVIRKDFLSPFGKIKFTKAAEAIGSSPQAIHRFMTDQCIKSNVAEKIAETYNLYCLLDEYEKEVAEKRRLIREKKAGEDMFTGYMLPPSAVVEMPEPSIETHNLIDMSILPKQWQLWCGYIERAV